MQTYVLDAWPLVAWLRNQPAAATVARLLREADSGVCALDVSILNLGEVFYRMARLRGVGQAQRDLATFSAQINVLPVSNDLVMRAAALKAAHKISYADGFAVATALELDAPLVTGDPEIGALARTLPQLQLHWLEN